MGVKMHKILCALAVIPSFALAFCPTPTFTNNQTLNQQLQAQYQRCLSQEQFQSQQLQLQQQQVDLQRQQLQQQQQQNGLIQFNNPHPMRAN